MNVLSVADPLAMVGHDAVGGAEQMIAALDGALVAAGHTSLVVAAHGSRCDGELIEVPASPGDISEPAMQAALGATRALIDEALRNFTIDVVHLHGHDMLGAMPDTD